MYEMVTLGVNGKLSRRIGVNLSATGSRTGAGATRLNSRGVIGALGLNYMITERVALYTIAEFYSQNLNRFPGTPIDRHRFYIGLKLSLRTQRMGLGAGLRGLPASLPIQMSGNQ